MAEDKSWPPGTSDSGRGRTPRAPAFVLERKKKSRLPWSEASLSSLTRQLLYAGLMASVWAAASQPSWAIWVVNGLGILLGSIQLLRWLDQRSIGTSALDEGVESGRWVGWSVAGLGLALCLWCLVSALNAAGAVDLKREQWTALGSFISWLPHSYDRPSTWAALFTGLGLLGYFWGTRNWLLAASTSDLKKDEGNTFGRNRKRRLSRTLLPSLHQLLWVLSISGTALVLLAIFQRATGTSRLLWVFPDILGRDGLDHFGPFASRNSAAQYLILLWPLAFGLWLFGGRGRSGRLQATTRLGSSPRIVLVFCGLAMLGGAVSTFSRGAWAVGLLTVLVVCVLTAAKYLPRNPGWTVASIGGLLAILSGLFFALWPMVVERLQSEFHSLPLERPEGLAEFTLAGVLDLSAAPRMEGLLLGVSELRRDSMGRPRAVWLGLRPDGTLSLMAWNSQRQTCVDEPLDGFIEKNKGTLVELVVVVHEGLRLFVNGKLVQYVEPDVTGNVLWPSTFAGGFMNVGQGVQVRGGGRDGIQRAVLWDRALSPLTVSRWLKLQAGESDPESPEPLVDFDYSRLGLRSLLWLKGGTALSRGDIRASAFQACRLAGVPPLLGSGPGTFPGLYAVSPVRLRGLKEMHVHNDYLEFLLTFGLPGSMLLLLAAGVVLGRPLLKGGIRMPQGFVVLLWTSLAACLVLAFIDWPFFSPPVRLLFVVLGGVLSCATIRQRAGGRRGSEEALEEDL
ncbi:MAG: hypothetical protein KDM81_01110 [Verrucomicrobiae bacterium]|nr:hypothetical protein [Verrucomicrobiae bacterium]